MTNVGLEPGPHTLDEIIAATDDGIYMETQPLLVDRRPAAQLPVRHRGRLRGQERPARAAAAQPDVHRHRPAVLGARWTCSPARASPGARPTAARASRARSATPAIPAAPARFRNVRVGVRGMSRRARTSAAGAVEALAPGASPAGRGRRRGRPPRARADPVRQLGDPPERRRGRHHPAAAACTTTAAPPSASATRGRRPRPSTPSSSASSPPRSVAPARPRLAGPGPARSTPDAAPASTRRPRGATPTDRADGRARRSSTAPAAWRRPATAAPNHWTGAFANSAGQAVAGEAVECGAGRHRPRPAAPTASPGTRRCASATSTARRWAPGRRPRRGPWADPVELPAGSLRGGARADAVADLLDEPRRRRASTARRSTERQSFVRVGADQFDPAITLVDDPLAARPDATTPRARRGTASTLVEGGRTRRGHPRPPLGRRGRRTSTGHRGDGRFGVGPGARHLGLVPAAARGRRARRRGRRSRRRLLGGRAGRRGRARAAGLRLLVHPHPGPALARRSPA